MPLTYSNKVSNSSFADFAHRLAYFSTEFMLYIKLRRHVKDIGSQNVVPLIISDLRSSLLTKFTSEVVTCPAGL